MFAAASTTSSFNGALIIPGLIVGALIGWLIGRNKGRGTEGIVLGGLLGCIGWVIVAVLKPKNQQPTGQFGGGYPPVPPQFPGGSYPPAPPTGTAPAGWQPDPFRRFQYRYWDGSKWTDQVSTDGRTYTDPPQ